MLKMPLKRFIQFVNDAKKLDEEYPCLKQREWLLKNWRCGDETAIYDPPAIAKLIVKTSPDTPFSAAPERGA